MKREEEQQWERKCLRRYKQQSRKKKANRGQMYGSVLSTVWTSDFM